MLVGYLIVWILKKLLSLFVFYLKMRFEKQGLELGIPEQLVSRQPFQDRAGVRIIGEVTEEKVRIVQEADAIYREEIGERLVLIKILGQYLQH